MLETIARFKITCTVPTIREAHRFVGLVDVTRDAEERLAARFTPHQTPGCVHDVAPAICDEFERAALYLVQERGAVSCTLESGYAVEPVRAF